MIVSPAATWLQFLPNHTRNVIIFVGVGTAWLVALVCTLVALVRRNTSAVWVGLLVMLLPLLAWLVLVMGVANSLRGF